MPVSVEEDFASVEKKSMGFYYQAIKDIHTSGISDSKQVILSMMQLYCCQYAETHKTKLAFEFFNHHGFLASTAHLVNKMMKLKDYPSHEDYIVILSRHLHVHLKDKDLDCHFRALLSNFFSIYKAYWPYLTERVKGKLVIIDRFGNSIASRVYAALLDENIHFSKNVQNCDVFDRVYNLFVEWTPPIALRTRIADRLLSEFKSPRNRDNFIDLFKYMRWIPETYRTKFIAVACAHIQTMDVTCIESDCVIVGNLKDWIPIEQIDEVISILLTVLRNPDQTLAPYAIYPLSRLTDYLSENIRGEVSNKFVESYFLPSYKANKFCISQTSPPALYRIVCLNPDTVFDFSSSNRAFSDNLKRILTPRARASLIELACQQLEIKLQRRKAYQLLGELREWALTDSSERILNVLIENLPKEMDGEHSDLENSVIFLLECLSANAHFFSKKNADRISTMIFDLYDQSQGYMHDPLYYLNNQATLECKLQLFSRLSDSLIEYAKGNRDDVDRTWCYQFLRPILLRFLIQIQWISSNKFLLLEEYFNKWHVDSIINTGTECSLPKKLLFLEYWWRFCPEKQDHIISRLMEIIGLYIVPKDCNDLLINFNFILETAGVRLTAEQHTFVINKLLDYIIYFNSILNERDHYGIDSPSTRIAKLSNLLTSYAKKYLSSNQITQILTRLLPYLGSDIVSPLFVALFVPLNSQLEKLTAIEFAKQNVRRDNNLVLDKDASDCILKFM